MKTKINKPATFQHIKIGIFADKYAENPRDEFDCLSRFYSPSSSRYITGGKKDLQISELYGSDHLAREIRQLRREGAVIVEFQNPHVGTCFAVVKRSSVIKEYGNDSRKSLYLARQVAKIEIYEYLSWANGEVYGFEITSVQTGEVLDSRLGFFGEQDARNEAESQAAYFEQECAQALNDVENRLVSVTK